jgi:hypothetical protein
MTGFGWCVHNSAAEGPARVIDRGRFATSSKDIFVRRYIHLRESVKGVIDKYPEIESVGIESPPFGELWSEGLYGLFVMVNEAIYVKRRDVVYFDPGSLKMLAKEDPDARKGKMHKIDMVETARTDTGITGSFNHNEADAYHLARFAARFFLYLRGEVPEEDLTPAEWRAFAKVHTFKRGVKAGQIAKLGAAFKEGQRFFRFSSIPQD